MADISSVKLQDNQTYYFKDNSAIVSISRSGNTYTATRHDGTTFEFTQKDDNTTYTFEDGVNSFTVTPSNGTAQTVTVTPSIPNATQSSDGLMSATDKTKLDGVANGAEVNQNAFSNIKVGSTTLAADSKTDTLEFVAGDNITLTPTEVSDKITISSSYTNTTYTLTQDATDGHKFSLEGTDGYFKEITIPDANTTYTIEADTTNNKIKLIPSSGSAVSITVPFATNATNATNATKATQDESGNNIKATYAASFSISDHTITLKNKNGTSLGTVTVPDNNTTYSFATGDSNGQRKVTPSEGSAQNISVKGLGTAAFKNTTDTYSSSGTDPVTGKAVASALETLPTPMVFKGTLGTGGTITQLPTASASTVGNTYRVITNGTYAGQVAKDGDEFIGAELSSGVYSWVYIPSADEPSGTVTSVGITSGGGLSVSGSPITTSGTITISHADTSSQASVDNSDRTYIQDISLDTYGHVTKITSATETVVNTDRYVNSASFAYDSTNDNVKMTLTRAGSDTATVPANIPKVSSSSAGVVPKGATVSSQSQSTKFLREDGTWAKPSYTTNTNTTYTIGTSGNTVTLTPSSGSVQSITVPFATNATNATKATQDANGDVIATTYRKLSNNDFDTINATEVNAGDLIVTGVGRFTNGLYGDLSGTATKVSNSLKIQLNGGTTEGTNQFTYDGSAAKTVNVTKSAIGLGNVDNTADANKSVASANTAGSATKATQDESGNNIKATYAASFSISDHTITLKNKNGVSLGTVTVPDNNDNTWRKVQVNGTDILGTATNTNPLNLKAGTNVSLSNSSGTVTITATDTNTTYTIGTSGNNVTLTPSSGGGSVQSITVPYATSAGSATDSTKMPLAGGTFTGRVIYNNVSMPLSAGKVTGLTAGTTEIFKDAIAFSNPTTSNDLGWIRVLGTGESDTVLEIATGDDGGGSTAEKIVARQYNTSSAISKEAVLLAPNGTTSFPVSVTSPKFIGDLDGNTYEAKLQWGGKNFSASYGCLDAALMDELGANRFQFIKASAITVEYTRDGGTTWTDYGATDAQKKQIFAQGGSLIIGKADSTNKATEHPGLYQLRITIDTGVANIYSYLNKFIVYITSSGSANCACKIQKALQSTPTTFVDHTDWIPISGWSGYNVLNTSYLVTYGNTASNQYGRVRFVFKDGEGGNTNYAGLSIMQIKAFGGVGWNTPSTMAKTGHIYSYNENMDATFPNNITATKFIGALQGNADTATTTSKLSGFTNTTTTGTAINDAITNGHYYVTGTSDIYGITDGAAFVQAYSVNYVAQIYQDYRTGQIALRGKTSGTWQAWRKVWDSVNLTSKTAAASGTDLSLVTTGEKATWNAKTSNTGTVTSVNATGASNTGISVTGGAITTSGTLTINLNLSDAINGLLTEGSSNAQRDDYIIAQYAGGGTTTKTYHRRKLSNIFAALNSSDITTALGYTPPSSDTKNTAGSTDTSSKIYLIGATSQAANPQTYSQDTAYVGTDGCLYSGGTKVLTAHQDISGKVSKTGDTMSGALNLANATKNSIGDDVAIGDFNIAGTLGIQGLNGATGIGLIKQGETWGTGANYAKISYDGTSISVSKPFTDISATTSVNANTGNSGTAGGLSLYGSAPTSYGIAMRTTANGGKHGAVQSDWAIYNYMINSGTNRGWIWKNSASGGGNVASIDCVGNAVFNGYVGIGGNTTNTSGVRQVYNETTKSLDFVFVA